MNAFPLTSPIPEDQHTPILALLEQAWKEQLGQVVREAWSKAVCEQFPNVPDSWKAPWGSIPERWKLVNMAVAQAVVDEIVSECLNCDDGLVIQVPFNANGERYVVSIKVEGISRAI